MNDDQTCSRCGTPRFVGDRFCPACGQANPGSLDLDRDGFAIDGTTDATPPARADMRSSLIGLGALAGLLVMVVILFLVTSPAEDATELAEPTPTPTATPTPTPDEVLIENQPPPPTPTEVPPTATPGPDMTDVLSALDLGAGRLVVSEDGEVASYDLETGERDVIAPGGLTNSITPVISWRGVSWLPGDGSGWTTNFWGGDTEQSPLPARFDPGFMVSAPTDGAVYTEIVFGTVGIIGRELLATHLATGEDVTIDLPRQVSGQVLSGWPPQVKAFRDSLYISSGGRLYRWRFSAREWVDAGPGTLVATTGPGVLVSVCSIETCTVRKIDGEGNSIDLPSVDPSALPRLPGESAAFSPDGKQLAFATIGSTPTLRGLRIARIVDLETGIARDVEFDQQIPEPLALSWVPNGSALLVTTQVGDDPTQAAWLRDKRLLLLDPDSAAQLELPLRLSSHNPFVLAVDIDALRGLPTGVDDG